jgi:hypothetical protein
MKFTDRSAFCICMAILAAHCPTEKLTDVFGRKKTCVAALDQGGW